MPVVSLDSASYLVELLQVFVGELHAIRIAMLSSTWESRKSTKPATRALPA
jgi:hypothetical protein